MADAGGLGNWADTVVPTTYSTYLFGRTFLRWALLVKVFDYRRRL